MATAVDIKNAIARYKLLQKDIDKEVRAARAAMGSETLRQVNPAGVAEAVVIDFKDREETFAGAISQIDDLIAKYENLLERIKGAELVKITRRKEKRKPLDVFAPITLYWLSYQQVFKVEGDDKYYAVIDVEEWTINDEVPQLELNARGHYYLTDAAWDPDIWPPEHSFDMVLNLQFAMNSHEIVWTYDTQSAGDGNMRVYYWEVPRYLAFQEPVPSLPEPLTAERKSELLSATPPQNNSTVGEVAARYSNFTVFQNEVTGVPSGCGCPSVPPGYEFPVAPYPFLEYENGGTSDNWTYNSPALAGCWRDDPLGCWYWVLSPRHPVFQGRARFEKGPLVTGGMSIARIDYVSWLYTSFGTDIVFDGEYVLGTTSDSQKTSVEFYEKYQDLQGPNSFLQAEHEWLVQISARSDGFDYSARLWGKYWVVIGGGPSGYYETYDNRHTYGWPDGDPVTSGPWWNNPNDVKANLSWARWLYSDFWPVTNSGSGDVFMFFSGVILNNIEEPPPSTRLWSNGRPYVQTVQDFTGCGTSHKWVQGDVGPLGCSVAFVPAVTIPVVPLMSDDIKGLPLGWEATITPGVLGVDDAIVSPQAVSGNFAKHDGSDPSTLWVIKLLPGLSEMAITHGNVSTRGGPLGAWAKYVSCAGGGYSSISNWDENCLRASSLSSNQAYNTGLGTTHGGGPTEYWIGRNIGGQRLKENFRLRWRGEATLSPDNTSLLTLIDGRADGEWRVVRDLNRSSFSDESVVDQEGTPLYAFMSGYPWGRLNRPFPVTKIFQGSAQGLCSSKPAYDKNQWGFWVTSTRWCDFLFVLDWTTYASGPLKVQQDPDRRLLSSAHSTIGIKVTRDVIDN